LCCCSICRNCCRTTSSSCSPGACNCEHCTVASASAAAASIAAASASNSSSSSELTKSEDARRLSNTTTSFPHTYQHVRILLIELLLTPATKLVRHLRLRELTTTTRKPCQLRALFTSRLRLLSAHITNHIDDFPS
jgi:hypothetical protein